LTQEDKERWVNRCFTKRSLCGKVQGMDCLTGKLESQEGLEIE